MFELYRAFENYIFRIGIRQFNVMFIATPMWCRVGVAIFSDCYDKDPVAFSFTRPLRTPSIEELDRNWLEKNQAGLIR